jgi:general secretion pathway protein B
MSYILDALRKADAERERDPARGIHAQPAVGATVAAARSGPPAWMWLAGGAVAVAGVAFVAWPVDGVAPIAAKPVAQPQPAAIAVPPQPVGAAIPVQVSAPMPVATAVQPAPPPMPVPTPQAPVAATTKPTPAVAVANAPAAAVPAAAPAPIAATDRVYAIAELPPDIQRDLPKLAITGGVHSDNAAQRMLIVGGQVMAEGAQLAPGVVLEEIRPKTAVVRFRGYRYSVGY